MSAVYTILFFKLCDHCLEVSNLSNTSSIFKRLHRGHHLADIFVVARSLFRVSGFELLYIV